MYYVYIYLYIYIYTYVYLRLHLKEIYPLCTLPSFCIAIPGYLLCTSVKSSNHTISHTIHIYIYIYIRCIYLQISVDFCYDVHVGKYTMWIFCGHGIPTWSPAEAFTNHHPASTSALVSGTELRMGEGIKKGSQMGKLYTLYREVTYPLPRHIFEDECPFPGLVGYVSFLEGNYTFLN